MAEGPVDPDRPPDRDRTDLVAGEAEAIARFGDGPALFSPRVPAPRYPYRGPLLPPDRHGSALVPARRDLPVPAPAPGATAWDRVVLAARRTVGITVAAATWAAGTVARTAGALARAALALVVGTPRDHADR